MTSKASPDDVTIRVQPKPSEEFITKVPKEVGDDYFDGKFELEVYPEHLTIPRNGSVTFKIVNPTEKFQEIGVEKKDERYDVDFWILGGHKKKLVFVLEPNGSKEVQMEHGDHVTGEQHVRKLMIRHMALKPEEAKKRSEELTNPVFHTEVYERYSEPECQYEKIEWMSTNRKTWFDYELQGHTGEYHLKVKIDPEPPVTSKEHAKDPSPPGKPRKEPVDPLAKKEKDKVLKDGCCCPMWCRCCEQ